MVRPTSNTEVGRRGGLTAPARRKGTGNPAAVPPRGRGKGPKEEPANAPKQNSDAALIYREGSTGAQVDPYTVLIFSVAFIAAVFLLHIWAKFSS